MPYSMSVSISTATDKTSTGTGVAAIVHWRKARPHFHTNIVPPPPQPSPVEPSHAPVIISSNPTDAGLPTPPSSVTSTPNTKTIDKQSIERARRAAEIASLLLALDAAIQRKEHLSRAPYFQFFIKTDSQYVTNIVESVASKKVLGVAALRPDEVERLGKVSRMVEAIGQHGFVAVKHVPRKYNRHAVWAAKAAIKGHFG